MLKPKSLRETLINHVPLLAQNPARLQVLMPSGQIVSTFAPSLSFEYHYQLRLIVTDYTDDIDLIIVPILVWLRENQPEMMASAEKCRTGFTFKTEAVSDACCNINIDLQLTERVMVRQEEDALHVDHLGEPPLPENVNRPIRLYVNGVLLSELDA
ncbi:hypothetical protein C7M52_00023 [Mixta theicola]|nr:phage tail protein [Mixta theicola]QHM74102.1 hypothetical protein C7M52_00023 [Mixta theicola]